MLIISNVGKSSIGSNDTTPSGNASFVHKATKNTIKPNKVACCVLKAYPATKNVASASIKASRIFFNLILSFLTSTIYCIYNRLKFVKRKE